MTSEIPVDVLEQKAAQQRLQLHNAVSELRQSVKHKLDVKRNVREHIGPAAGVMALIGLTLGYTITGVFFGD